MNKSDDDPAALVEHRSRKMFSSAIYLKLKAVVDSWRHEERGKARVAAAALYGLLAWSVLFIVSALVVPAHAVLISFAGFLAWIAFVAVMLRKYLGIPEKP